MKRVLTSCLVVLICLTAFLSGYGKGCYSYATNQDGTLTNDELDVAVSSWLQSHGGNLFSPQNYRARKTYEAGLIHNFIYGDGGGYDSVRQHINGGVGGNNELKFDFDGFIIQKLNTWLNRELQNGTFGEGAELNENDMLDDGVDNLLHSGIYFTDVDGYTCEVFTTTASSLTSLKTTNTLYGTPYKYNTQQIVNDFSQYTSNTYLTYTFNCSNQTTVNQRINVFIDKSTNYHYKITTISANTSQSSVNGRIYYELIRYANDNSTITETSISETGYPCVVSFQNTLKFGIFTKHTSGNDSITQTVDIQQGNSDNADIYFITNNNNNVSVYPTIVDAEGHLYITPKVNVGVDGEINYQPYIVNEGDTINNVINQYYIDSNTPDKTISYPTDNPDDNGGGGGSTDNPSGGNPPNWNNPFPHLSPDGEGGFNFNFTLPDLNIDWNISGLKDKFPFSIPFDLIHFVEVLNAEPETPEFDWIIDLKIYQWHIDADLHQFDNLAGIVRNVEFIGFCITLVLITRRMIKG